MEPLRKTGAKRIDPNDSYYAKDKYRAKRAEYWLEQGRQRSKKNAAERRERMHAIKRAEGCAYCGENDPYCLEWHHDPQQPKLGQLSTLGYSGRWDDFEEERKRCVLLCANCHKKVTWKVLPDPFTGEFEQAA